MLWVTESDWHAGMIWLYIYAHMCVSPSSYLRGHQKQLDTFGAFGKIKQTKT